MTTQTTLGSMMGPKSRSIGADLFTPAQQSVASLAAGQITMRKVDGWQTLTRKLAKRAG
jgi:hypothetical protein